MSASCVSGTLNHMLQQALHSVILCWSCKQRLDAQHDLFIQARLRTIKSSLDAKNLELLLKNSISGWRFGCFSANLARLEAEKQTTDQKLASTVAHVKQASLTAEAEAEAAKQAAEDEAVRMELIQRAAANVNIVKRCKCYIAECQQRNNDMQVHCVVCAGVEMSCCVCVCVR